MGNISYDDLASLNDAFNKTPKPKLSLSGSLNDAAKAVNFGVPVIISKQSGVSEVLRNTLQFDFWDKIQLLFLTLLILGLFYLVDGNHLRVFLYATIIVLIIVVFISREKNNLKLIYSWLPSFIKFNAKESTSSNEE